MDNARLSDDFFDKATRGLTEQGVQIVRCRGDRSMAKPKILDRML